MNSKASRLLELHIAFEKKQILSGKRWQTDLHSALERAETLTLQTFLNREELLQSCRILLRTGVPPSLLEEWLHRQHIQLKNTHYPLNSILSAEDLDGILKESQAGIELFRWMASLIIKSEVFATVAADILYTGIKKFTLEKNALLSVPGAQALLKMGQSLVEQAGFTDKAESVLRSFISQNTGSIIVSTERLILENLKEEHMESLARELHARMSDATIAGITGMMAESGPTLAGAILRAKNHELLYNLMVLNLDFLLNLLARKTLGELLSDAGLKNSEVVSILVSLILPALEALEAQGLLEEILAARLTPFYESAGFLALLDAD
ncbi:MAG: hypothetical protein HS115_10900 [Spirochaetales bacterium]|nr:hypothetical protein [Spirochaetales bacterium]